MKLTKTKLKQIIREEIQKLNEGNLFDTDSKKQKFIRKKGNIIIFKKPFGPTRDSHIQITSRGVTKIRAKVKKGWIKIIGWGYDTDWFKSEKDLLNAIDWDAMDNTHDGKSFGNINGLKKAIKKQHISGNDKVQVERAIKLMKTGQMDELADYLMNVDSMVREIILDYIDKKYWKTLGIRTY